MVFDWLGFFSFTTTSLIFTSFIASFLTVVAGIGGGILLLAVMVSLFPPSIVIPLHAVVQLGSNGSRALLFRQFFRWDIIAAFLTGAIVAAVLGSQVIVSLDESTLQLVLALFILYMVWGPKKSNVDFPPQWRRYFAGFISTFLSFFVGASGPVVAVFILREELKKEAQVATHAVIMFLQHSLKIIVFGVLGFSFSEYALLLICMIGSGFLGSFLGRKMLLKLPEKLFKLIFKGVITLLALRLLYAALL